MARRLYVQCRLFNVNDRLATINLCDRIDRWIDMGLLVDMEHTFLPIRDDPADVANELEIFNNDIAAINECSGMTGFYDGATYDSGCSFEIGYAYTLGYPIDLVTTDFFKWALGGSSNFYFCSQLLNTVATLATVPDMNPNITDYRQKNLEQLERAFSALQSNLVFDFGTVKPPAPKIDALPVEYDYYLDPNFQYTEAGRYLLNQIVDAIRAANKTFVYGNNMGLITNDIDNLRKSGRAIFLSDVFEPDLDSGILQGIAYGIGRKPYTYASNKKQYLEGADWYGYLNCMITYSAEQVVNSIDELAALI